MSSGTFTLNPGPPSVGIDPANYAGALATGTVAGTTALSVLVGDLALQLKLVPTALINQAYLRAARDLCKKAPGLIRRTIAATPLTPNVAAYNFGTDPTFEVVGVRAAQIQQMNNTWVNLRYTSQDTFDPNMKTDLPNWYAYLPEGMIVYYPTPNLAYNTLLELNVQPNLAAQVIPNDLVQKFNIWIEEGAKEFLYGLDQEPWYSPTERDRAGALFERGVASARSWVDKGFQSGSQRATPRPFLSR